MISCPECDAVLELDPDELQEGDSLSCEECGASLIVSSTDPEIELTVDDEAEYDEDYDEDEDDDEDGDDFDDEDEEEEDDEDSEDEEWR